MRWIGQVIRDIFGSGDMDLIEQHYEHVQQFKHQETPQERRERLRTENAGGFTTQAAEA